MWFRYISITTILNSVFLSILLVVSIVSAVQAIEKTQLKQKSISTPLSIDQKSLFRLVEGDEWETYNGTLYPYVFSAPKRLGLISFPDDVYDMRASTFGGVVPQSVVLIGVADISKEDRFKGFVNQPKMRYIKAWKDQFATLTDIESIEEFRSLSGLKGYKVQFRNQATVLSTYDVFFEVENRPEIIIHMSQNIIAEDVFWRIVQSVSWSK